MLSNVPEVLKSCPLSTIRKWHERMWFMLSMYQQGLTGPLAEFAAKKYKSHRAALSKVVIDAVEVQQLQSELAAKLKN